MGKLITFLTILIFVDLLFVVTGQVCNQGTCSLGSIIFNAILNIDQATSMQFYKEIIGDLGNLVSSTTGILALLAAAATVTAGIVFSSTDTLKFVPIAATFAIMTSDFVVIAAYLVAINALLATIIMSPIIIIYTITVVEWLRGQD